MNEPTVEQEMIAAMKKAVADIHDMGLDMLGWPLTKEQLDAVADAHGEMHRIALERLAQLHNDGPAAPRCWSIGWTGEKDDER